MRIGIDATALPPKPAGAGIYITHLVRELASIGDSHEFVVFAHRSGLKTIEKAFEVGWHSKLEWVTAPDKSPAHRLLWEQVSV